MNSGFRVGGVILPHGPFMIGAGVCKNPTATKEWLQVAPVVSGSYTPEQRDGNSGNVVYPDTLEEVRRLGFGLNSMGMPNMGFEMAAKELSTIGFEQPLIVSVAGFSVDDYMNGVKTFSNLQNIDAIELNFGCPNTQGEHPDIMSFNPDAVTKILEGIRVGKMKSKPIWLKFSPYSNPRELQRMAELVNNYNYYFEIAVVTCNTFADAYAGEGKIDPNNGQGGLSGPKLKEAACGQVRAFRRYLDSNIDVIGVGGIFSGEDILDFIDAGAKAIQMTSWPFWAGKPSRFMDELTSSKKFMDYLEATNNQN